MAGALLAVSGPALAQVGDNPRTTPNPPHPSKLVIVFEENKSFSQIVGNPDAPYLNQLANEGMLFTNFYAITHPSQPNYLEFFSGSNQDIPGNENPASGAPFNTPNLASSLMQAGYTFAGYAESLPWVGSTVPTWGYYTRLTNPWVNWQAFGPAGTNQIESGQNLPFWMFPSDFSELPDVSIVVPNLKHNSHDGTIEEADDWLFNNIKPYADWARSNNGMLIVTYDEDESQSRNRIPTIMFGPMVRPGFNNATWTLHNLLRTVQDLYGAAPSGTAQSVRPIAGYSAISADNILDFVFHNGVNGYTGTQDTYLEQQQPQAQHGQETSVWTIDDPLRQGLIRFDAIAGAGNNQVPVGTTVLSAKLSVYTGVTTFSDRSFDTMSIHRMLAPWDESSTWDSMDNGVSTDDVEGAAEPEFSLTPNVGSAWAIFDVTASVQAWVNDPSTNHGWLIRSSGSDTWRWRSSEWGTVTDRPVLDIVISYPNGPGAFGLISPADGAVHQPTEPTLTWSDAPDATSYSLRIATNLSLTDPVHTAAGLTAASYDVPARVLNLCTGYYWGVTAVNGYGSMPSTPLSSGFYTLFAADYNGDGYVDGIDYDQFNNDFENPDPVQQMRADYNHDGFVDGIDYDNFNNDFESGC